MKTQKQASQVIQHGSTDIICKWRAG